MEFVLQNSSMAPDRTQRAEMEFHMLCEVGQTAAIGRGKKSNNS